MHNPCLTAKVIMHTALTIGRGISQSHTPQTFQAELQSSFLDEKRPPLPFIFKRSEELHDVLLSTGIVRMVADLLVLPVPSANMPGKRVQVGSLKVLELDLEDTTRVVLRYRDLLAEVAVSTESGHTDIGVPGASVVSEDSAWTHLKHVFSSAYRKSHDIPATPTSQRSGLDRSLNGPASLAHGVILLRSRMKSPLELKHAERNLHKTGVDDSSGIRGTVTAATLQAHSIVAEAVLKLLWVSVRMGPSSIKVYMRAYILRLQLRCQ